MIENFTAPECLPFAVALTIMVILGFIEGMGTVLGLGISDLLDSFLPDMDVDIDVDIDGPELDHSVGVEVGHMQEIGPFTRMLSWLRVGRVPILILLVVFLLVFGLSGLMLQSAVHGALGFRLPALGASLPALLIAIPSLNVIGGWLENVIPRDETSAVSQDSFIGRVAVITLGTASENNPAQARLRDRHQQAHYVMVEPDEDGVTFGQGTQVLLVSREGARYKGIANPSPALSEEVSA